MLADSYYTLAHGSLHSLLNVKPARPISAERDGYVAPPRRALQDRSLRNHARRSVLHVGTWVSAFFIECKTCKADRCVIMLADSYYTLAHGSLHSLLNVKPARPISAERDGYVAPPRRALQVRSLRNHARRSILHVGKWVSAFFIERKTCKAHLVGARWLR